MPENLVLIQVGFPAHSLKNVRANHDRVYEDMGSFKGFRGLSAWSEVNREGRGLGIYHYADSQSAEEGLRRIVEDEAMIESMVRLTDTPDVINFEVTAKDGFDMDHTGPNAYLSLSERFSAPGFGSDLDQDLNRVFSELRLVPGYLGSIRGFKVGLEEERIGIVLWESREAFEASLPNQPMYHVQLFRRAI